jgi:hypothetical protein
MSIWPRYPALYEINTWVWLSKLSLKTATSVDLSSVPSTEWDAIAKFGFAAVWFMGAWERSPAGIAIANQNENLVDDFRRALPDFEPEDNVGSPYCIRRCVVDKHVGGPEGLAIAGRELAKRGMKLLLDFVPNHVEDARNEAASYIEVHGSIFACNNFRVADPPATRVKARFAAPLYARLRAWIATCHRVLANHQ